MTERKPQGISWQSWIERQIQQAQQGGAFDDLAGHGRPIEGLDVVHDELWWVKAKLRDEDIEYLPPTIAIRAERQDAIDAAMRATTERAATFLIEEVNQRIRYLNSHATSGPPSSVVAIDLEGFMERWRAEHPPEELPMVDPTIDEHATPRRHWRRRSRWSRWWRRTPPQIIEH